MEVNFSKLESTLLCGHCKIVPMSKVDDYVQQFIVEQESDLREIAAPLDYLEISGFSYSKIYDNGRFMTLTTNAKWAEFHFDKFFKCEYAAADIQSSVLATDASLWISNPDNQIWRDATQFNLAGSMLLAKRQVNYLELYCYTTTADNHKSVDFYLNNQKLLHDFGYLFKDRASYLIKAAELNALQTPREYLVNAPANPTDNTAELHKQFYEAIQPQRLYIDDNSYLTAKEIECLQWCIRGKTAAEIGLLLGITKRTVESHLDKIKLKLNCYKQTDLIRRTIEIGIYDILMKR